jgi:hypothetical protein
MPQVLVELDDDLMARLERVAPARSRRRSEFIRAAIREALWTLEEARTAQAYGRQPDEDPPHFDPEDWEPAGGARTVSRRRRA